MPSKKILYTVIALWVLFGTYGIVFNHTDIDETKYLFKGYLIASGEVSYYQAENFYYQHMPGVFLWFGGLQKLLGPSLLAGRIQSFFVGLLIVYFTFKLGQKIKNKLTGLLAIALLVCVPANILYYSTATPTPLIALLLILGMIALYSEKYFIASIVFAGTFLVKENFLYTLLFYIFFLFFRLWKKPKILITNVAGIMAFLALFMLPAHKEIREVLFRIDPGGTFSRIVQRTNITGYYPNKTVEIFPHLKGLVYFWSVYFPWIILLAGIVLLLLTKRLSFAGNLKKIQFFIFLNLLWILNLAAHFVGTVSTSPRALVSYLPYFSPLIALSMAVFLEQIFKKIKLKPCELFYLFIFYFVFFGFPSLRDLSLQGYPPQKPDLIKLSETAENLKQIIKKDEKVIWFSNPMALYLANRRSYFPLINGVNCFTANPNKREVEELGLWNKEIVNQWFNEADIVFVNPNKIKSLSQKHQAGKDTAELIQNRLDEDFCLKENLSNYLTLKPLIIYKKKNSSPCLKE